MRWVCPECGEVGASAGTCPRDGAAFAEGTDGLLGTTLGSYRIASRIGEGGMGRVYLAVQPNIGARVAIKVLAKERAQDLVELERFFAEARLVNLIRHENIVNVLDLLIVPNGPPCIVMEHLDGAPLSAAIAARAPLQVHEVIELAEQVLAALGAAHAKGVVHRDLKPENIFVTRGGRAKVLDFGIAKLLGATPGSGPTRAGAFLGTPAYLAPEQVREARDIDGRADLYSLGVVLFEALTGRLPFGGDSTFDLLRAHVETAPPALRPLAPHVPQALENVVLRALAKDPADRFASAEEMARELTRAAGPAREDPVPSTLPQPRPAPPNLPKDAHLSTLSSGAIAHAPTATAPPPSSTASRAPMFVAIASAAIAVAAGVVALRPGMNLRNAVPSPMAGEEKLPAGANAFDVTSYLPEAEARAKKIAPDARLYTLDATPVTADGRVDVSAGSTNSNVRYAFLGTKDGKTTSIFVEATAGVVRVLVAKPYAAMGPPASPRCTSKEVMERADVGPHKAQLNFGQVGDAWGPMWIVTTVDGRGHATLNDDCPPR